MFAMIRGRGKSVVKSLNTTALVSLPLSAAPGRYSSSLRAEEFSMQSSTSGTGGKSSVSGFVATVFGATGYSGRYVVDALGKIGSIVVVPYRGTDWSYKHLKILGELGQIVPVQFDPCDPTSIAVCFPSPKPSPFPSASPKPLMKDETESNSL